MNKIIIPWISENNAQWFCFLLWTCDWVIGWILDHWTKCSQSRSGYANDLLICVNSRSNEDRWLSWSQLHNESKIFANKYNKSKPFSKIKKNVRLKSSRESKVLQYFGSTYTYHVTEAVQAMKGALSGCQYRGSWCADALCIALLRVWFEGRTNKRITESNSETYALWVRTGP